MNVKFVETTTGRCCKHCVYRHTDGCDTAKFGGNVGWHIRDDGKNGYFVEDTAPDCGRDTDLLIALLSCFCVHEYAAGKKLLCFNQVQGQLSPEVERELIGRKEGQHD